MDRLHQHAHTSTQSGMGALLADCIRFLKTQFIFFCSLPEGGGARLNRSSRKKQHTPFLYHLKKNTRYGDGYHPILVQTRCITTTVAVSVEGTCLYLHFTWPTPRCNSNYLVTTRARVGIPARSRQKMKNRQQS